MARREAVGPQVCRKHGKPPHTYETWLKRMSNRMLRRWAKRDPEGAPTKRKFHGYSD